MGRWRADGKCVELREGHLWRMHLERADRQSSSEATPHGPGETRVQCSLLGDH